MKKRISLAFRFCSLKVGEKEQRINRISAQKRQRQAKKGSKVWFLPHRLTPDSGEYRAHLDPIQGNRRCDVALGKLLNLLQAVMSIGPGGRAPDWRMSVLHLVPGMPYLTVSSKSENVVVFVTSNSYCLPVFRFLLFQPLELSPPMSELPFHLI